MMTAPSSGRPMAVSAVPNAAIEASSAISAATVKCRRGSVKRAERASNRAALRATKIRTWPAKASLSHSGAPTPPVAPVTKIVFCKAMPPPIVERVSSCVALGARGSAFLPGQLPGGRGGGALCGADSGQAAVEGPSAGGGLI